jgi:hypothetical protein
LDTKTFVRSSDVVQREVAGETFLVPIRGHMAHLRELFVVDEVGGWVWEHLDGRTLDQLAEGIAAEFDVDTARALGDAQSFVKELVEAGLAEGTQQVLAP